MNQYTTILKELREDHDLKQKEVAKIIGTTQQHYSRYETGGYEIPVYALCKLADYYGVSTDYILGRVSYSNATNKISKEIQKNPLIGEIFTDVISLSAEGQFAVRDYTNLHIIKEKA